jgi:hypothetical protein
LSVHNTTSGRGRRPHHAYLAGSGKEETLAEVGVLPTVDTGRAAADVVYFGNAVGETGKKSANRSYFPRFVYW